MVLVIGEDVVRHLVQDAARVREVPLRLLLVRGGEVVLLGERSRQATPNAVGVELERSTESLMESVINGVSLHGEITCASQ